MSGGQALRLELRYKACLRSQKSHCERQVKGRRIQQQQKKLVSNKVESEDQNPFCIACEVFCNLLPLCHSEGY